jgi:hypothetical protein
LHRAKIQLLDSPLGGLRVQVLFGATAGDASTLQANQPAPALSS